MIAKTNLNALLKMIDIMDRNEDYVSLPPSVARDLILSLADAKKHISCDDPYNGPRCGICPCCTTKRWIEEKFDFEGCE